MCFSLFALLWPQQEACTFPESAGNQAQVFLAAFRNLISTPWRAVGEAGVLRRVHGRNGRSADKESQISRPSEKHGVDCMAWKNGFTIISTAFCVASGPKLALVIILVMFMSGDRETSLLLPVSPKLSVEWLVLLQREGFCCYVMKELPYDWS